MKWKKKFSRFFSFWIFLAINIFLYISHFLKNNQYSVSLYFEPTNQFYENPKLFFFSVVFYGASSKILIV